MAHPLKVYVSSAVFACTLSAIPVAGAAQMADVAPSGSFSFAGFFGSAEARSLPLELSDDSSQTVSPAANQLPPVLAAPETPDVQTTRLRSRLVRNTWSVGVFR